jgi:4-carboxymuconolactone decarboxylase
MKILTLAATATLLAAVSAPPAAAERRFPPIDPAAMSPEQKAIWDAIANGPRKSTGGPFNAWLRSPALADRLQKVGEYVRFQSSLPKRLNELAILISGRYWGSGFEWDYHYPLALQAGVPASVLADLAAGRVPAGMTDDEALIYAASTELRRDRNISDATYAKALQRFGERGVLDLIAVNGYYDLVCMTLNVAQVPVPAGSKVPPLQPLPPRE